MLHLWVLLKKPTALRRQAVAELFDFKSFIAARLRRRSLLEEKQ
jgi:hypothetical protein